MPTGGTGMNYGAQGGHMSGNANTGGNYMGSQGNKGTQKGFMAK